MTESRLAEILNGWYNGLWTLVLGILVLAVLLGFTTGMIWIERRLLARFQDRLGPNRVGPAGLLQPVADIIKLFYQRGLGPAFRR